MPNMLLMGGALFAASLAAERLHPDIYIVNICSLFFNNLVSGSPQYIVSILSRSSWVESPSWSAQALQAEI